MPFIHFHGRSVVIAANDHAFHPFASTQVFAQYQRGGSKGFVASIRVEFSRFCPVFMVRSQAVTCQIHRPDPQLVFRPKTQPGQASGNSLKNRVQVYLPLGLAVGSHDILISACVRVSFRNVGRADNLVGSFHAQAPAIPTEEGFVQVKLPVEVWIVGLRCGRAALDITFLRLQIERFSRLMEDVVPLTPTKGAWFIREFLVLDIHAITSKQIFSPKMFFCYMRFSQIFILFLGIN